MLIYYMNSNWEITVDGNVQRKHLFRVDRAQVGHPNINTLFVDLFLKKTQRVVRLVTP